MTKDLLNIFLREEGYVPMLFCVGSIELIEFNVIYAPVLFAAQKIETGGKYPKTSDNRIVTGSIYTDPVYYVVNMKCYLIFLQRKQLFIVVTFGSWIYLQ